MTQSDSYEWMPLVCEAEEGTSSYKGTSYRRGASIFFVIVCAILAWQTARAASAISGKCEEQEFTFDGLKVIQYGMVSERVERLVMSASYPGNLAGASPKSNHLLIAGDPVAIGGACGRWSYVQHMGQNEVWYGWVETDRLVSTSLSLPFDGGVPGGQDPGMFLSKWRVRVALKKGHGVPVCEAYVQRLNQTLFYEPPFCGRPDNDQVPGFVRLNSKPLSSLEVNKLAVSIENLSFRPPAHFVMKHDALALAESASRIGDVYLDTRGIVPAIPKGENIAVWRYDPRIDIDNDGIPDNVIQFSGFTWEPCGRSTEKFPDSGSEVPRPFVLSDDGSSIDVVRTESLFGSQEATARGIKAGLPGYYPIGYSVSFFKYRDKYFLDAFVGDPTPSDGSRQIIHVFRRDKAVLEEVCRVENIDPDWRLLQ